MNHALLAILAILFLLILTACEYETNAPAQRVTYYGLGNTSAWAMEWTPVDLPWMRCIMSGVNQKPGGIQCYRREP